jgi:diguanylate cyclase (GGDEF)-like protein
MPNGDLEGMIDLARRISMELASDANEALTLSYGGATLEDQPSSFASLREEADRALYEAKRAGRNRIVVSYSGGWKSAEFAVNTSLANPLEVD